MLKKVWMLAPLGAIVALSPLVTKPVVLAQVDETIFQIDLAVQDMSILLERQRIESGYLSTSITTRVQSAEGIPSHTQALCFDLVTEVQHGFKNLLSGNLATTKTTLLPLSEENQQECGIEKMLSTNPTLLGVYKENFGDTGPLEIRSQYGIAGTSSGDVVLKPFKLEFPDEASPRAKSVIESGKLVAHVESVNGMEHISFDMEWGGYSALIESKNGPIKFRVNEMLAKGEQYVAYENIWLGHVNQSIKGISISHMEAGRINAYQLPEILIDSNSFEDESGIQSSLVMQINDINNALGDVKIDLGLSDLDGKALADISSMVDDMVQDEAPELTEQQTERLLQSLNEIAGKASLDIHNISYTIDGSTVSLNGSMNAKKVFGKSLKELEANPMELLKLIFIELNASIDKSFSDAVSGPVAQVLPGGKNIPVAQVNLAKESTKGMIDAQLAGIIAMGYMVDNGNAYTSNVKLENGKATINGKEMALPIPPKWGKTTTTL